MSVSRKATMAGLLLGVAFLIGYWIPRPHTPSSVEADYRKPLYYRCPMHPAYHSDKPGIAPDCGMQLEPVYAGEEAAAPAPPGAIRISGEKQKRIGLAVARATRLSGPYTVRVLGRVAADESRIHRVTALADGVIRQVSAASAGNLVQKDELLASYFVSTPELYSAIQGYFVAMRAREQGLNLSHQKDILDAEDAQIRLSQELLQSYGVTPKQLEELARTRRTTRDIEFRAPASGMILARNAAPGQRAERGAELFRIAELNRVWVLADLFENDSRLVRPGSSARVRYRGETYRAAVSPANQFDPASRTLKIRLEMDNPRLVLRPDMFVDVELDAAPSDRAVVPVDALVDSGLRRAVYVANPDGSFAPREVVTGARYGDRVEVLSGLNEGEAVVVSGLFLLDSESRLRMASAAPAPPDKKPAAGKAVDPVCGMEIEIASATPKSEYQGLQYYFCSQDCKKQFDSNPARYAKKGGRS